MNPTGANGLIFGNPRLLGIQILGIVVCSLWAALVTFVLLKMLERILGKIRINEEQEEVGLDQIDHEETAYNYDSMKIRTVSITYV